MGERLHSQRGFTMRLYFLAAILASALSLPPSLCSAQTDNAVSRADSSDGLLVGAAIVDVTPQQFPVLVNGGFMPRSASEVKTKVNARSIVVQSGSERIALVVVDSCMIPKQLIDHVKQRATQETKLKRDQIMISATHTHTAPSAFAALGTPADETYIPFLREQLVESLVQAEANLQPARYGWGAADASQFTALRRWILRPDRIREDPFGNPTVRASMHTARNIEDVTGPSGPEDPELSMIAFETLEGKPIAALANFSMHYYGDRPISADYFGLFCAGLERHVSSKREPSKDDERPFVAVLSHGCSGDIWRRDYATWSGEDPTTIDSYTDGLLGITTELYDSIDYQTTSSIAMAEARIPLRYRVPDKQRLEWGQRTMEQFKDGKPGSQTEVYAMEQVLLHEMQQTEVVVQGIRIGDIAIATTPNETYALTGLKIKARSPLTKTMVIELANGADGYIPPPEQHQLGGYNTWAARSAGLEEQAEPKIAATAISLLEQVSQKPRRQFEQSAGQAAQKRLEAHPAAYLRLHEMEGPVAIDSSPNGHHGIVESGVVFFLEGPQNAAFADSGDVNRCAHFAGGRIRMQLGSIGASYSVEMSIWNGMPVAARDTTGWFFSRDFPDALSNRGDHVGIGGTATQPGRLIFRHGNHDPVQGKTELKRWTWNRILFVRDGGQVRVYLNGNPEPEIDTKVESFALSDSVFIGGRSDNDANFEGRIDEVTVFNRAIQSGDLQ